MLVSDELRVQIAAAARILSRTNEGADIQPVEPEIEPEPEPEPVLGRLIPQQIPAAFEEPLDEPQGETQLIQTMGLPPRNPVFDELNFDLFQ